MFKNVLLVGVAFASPIFAQTNGTAPANLLIAAQKSPGEFAMLLATASVPSGIELKEGDEFYPSVNPDYTMNVTNTVPVTDLVKMFNSQHHDYRATTVDGVLVIRPLEGRVRYLDEPSPIKGHTAVVGLMTAAKHVFLPLQPGLLGPTVGSRLGEGDRGEDAHVALDGVGSQKVMDSLNQIVRQVPRTWYVVSRQVGDEWQIARFGFLHGSGMTSYTNLLPRVAK
jgi:hypothetical protein